MIIFFTAVVALLILIVFVQIASVQHVENKLSSLTEEFFLYREKADLLDKLQDSINVSFEKALCSLQEIQSPNPRGSNLLPASTGISDLDTNSDKKE